MSQQQQEDDDDKKTKVSERNRPSLSVRLIRHAESYNNQVYRNARYIYRGGTPEFDEAGWTCYVNEHRQADPGLSDTGRQQAQCLSQFLVQHVTNQASQPLTVISSPMKRTLETIRPTLQALAAPQQEHATNMLVHGFYFESEGCHIREVAQEGMNPQEIREFLRKRRGENSNDSNDEQQQQNDNDDETNSNSTNVSFVGFPNPDRGWYCNGTGGETRACSEVRAAKFYVWLCDYLDEQLQQLNDDDMSCDDVFDAGVSQPGEEEEVDHDRLAPRQRKRRTCLLVGHGDFMSLVLKRIVAGFGHYVEHDGVPHRSAFVHFNTGMTELEYFGHGRFLLMSHNATPHLLQAPPITTITAANTDTADVSLRTGGSLKDGWSYLMPNDEFVLDGEVAVAFSDEDLQDNEHVREQTQALKALYHLGSSSSSSASAQTDAPDNKRSNNEDVFSVEQQEDNTETKPIHFIVQRGLQVVGTATYSEQTGIVSDVAVRPSGGRKATETLLRAVKDHAQRKLGRSGSLLVVPRSTDLQHQQLLDELGFEQVVAAPTTTTEPNGK